MNCNLVKDLIPLYIDGCCSVESKKIVEEHIKSCSACQQIIDDMTSLSDVVTSKKAPKKMSRINDWKASVLQSVLLFLSFALITIGVALEAKTPLGLMNGFWASNLVIPATGFMLSLANWYFVKLYKNRKRFSDVSLFVTLLITVCGYVWGVFHYDFFDLSFLKLGGIGILLTAVFCVLSKVLSNRYAVMLGKE